MSAVSDFRRHLRLNDRKKHGWAFWLTVTLVALPVLYVACFGPVCWWLRWRVEQQVEHYKPLNAVESALCFLYAPCGWVAIEGPPIVSHILLRYASVELQDGYPEALIPLGWNNWDCCFHPDANGHW